jgi:peptidoglycan/LPS O-acetylase OafA/YrhL
VHAWIPYPSSYFSFNSPSWTLSTDFGLYLLFPLLVRNLRETWLRKLALSIALLGIAHIIAGELGLPVYDPLGRGADRAGIMVNPLSCIHLFMVGMAASLAWKWLEPRVRLGVAFATALEIVALASAFLSIAKGISLNSMLSLLPPALLAAPPSWLPPLHAVMVTFPFLLVTLALRRGLVSRALSRPTLVTLGEMSFSLYLIHHPVRAVFDPALNVLKRLGAWWQPIPELAFAGLYWLSSLIAAWLLWRFVECPARDWIRTWWRAHEANIAQRQWSMAVAALASAAMVAFAGVVIHLR